MDVSNLGNFTTGQKQTSDTNLAEGSKSARSSATASAPQETTTEGAQTSPIPPVNQASELSGEEGNSVSPESGSGQAVDLLA
jgi:hypothetical protein